METLDSAWGRAFAPKDRRPIHEWAHDNVTLFPPLTKHGPFDASDNRHFLLPFEWLADDHVREVNILAPVRSGKTLIADVWLPWVIANDPGPFRWVFQDDAIAKEHAETRAMKILKSCAACRALLPDDRHKVRDQEIIFANGMPLYIQGPALGKLQSKGFRYMVLDEPWLYQSGTIGEAKGRLGDYIKMATSKLLCISQGGDPDNEWATQFASGEINVWHVQCQNCDQFMPAQWSGRREDGSRWGMVWEDRKDDKGFWLIEECQQSIRWECKHCRHPHVDGARTKAEWNRTGKYVIHGQARRARKSATWTAVIDYPWVELVGLWLEARNAFKLGNITPTIQFIQKRLAEHSGESSVAESSDTLARATFNPEVAWPDEKARIMTVDRQEEDTFWVTVRGWSATESRRLHFGKVYSFEEIEALRIKLKVPPQWVLVDSGYRPKGDQGVYAACIKFGWIAAKGVDQPFFWHSITSKGVTRRVQRSYAEMTYGDPGIGTAMQGRGGMAPLIRFSSPTMSERVKALEAKGRWMEPPQREGDESAEYARQMNAEFKKRKRDKFSGAVTYVWVCPSGNNHAFDLAKMQVLGATLLDLLPDTENETPEPAAETAPEPV